MIYLRFVRNVFRLRSVARAWWVLQYEMAERRGA
jgi:hypothetical protein